MNQEKDSGWIENQRKTSNSQRESRAKVKFGNTCARTRAHVRTHTHTKQKQMNKETTWTLFCIGRLLLNIDLPEIREELMKQKEYDQNILRKKFNKKSTN